MQRPIQALVRLANRAIGNEHENVTVDPSDVRSVLAYIEFLENSPVRFGGNNDQRGASITFNGNVAGGSIFGKERER